MQQNDVVQGKKFEEKKYLRLEVKEGSAGPSAAIFSKVERYFKLYLFLLQGLDNYLPPKKESLKKALKTKKLWRF